MARRRPNGRLVKIHRSHTIDEVARVLGVHKGTIRRWIKQGLPCLSEQRPSLILGQDLRDFLDKRKSKKIRCELDECFCLSCKAPRRPAFGEVEFLPMPPRGGNIRALCEHCSTVMHKRISADGLTALEGNLTVTLVQGEPHLVNGTVPCTNDDLRKDLQTHA